MAPLDYSQWPIEHPSKDFAKRTVGEILRQDRAAKQRRTRRWVMAFALAATFAATGALAMMTSKYRPPLVPLQQSAATYASVSVQPVQPPNQILLAPESLPSATAKPVMIRRPVPIATASASASSPPSARPLVLPRCDCAPSDHVCSCLE